MKYGHFMNVVKIIMTSVVVYVSDLYLFIYILIKLSGVPGVNGSAIFLIVCYIPLGLV